MGKLCLRFYFLNLTHLLNVANRYGCHYLNICVMVRHDKNIRWCMVDCEAAGSHALHMVRRVRVTLFYDSACSWKKFPFHIPQRFIIISDSLLGATAGSWDRPTRTFHMPRPWELVGICSLHRKKTSITCCWMKSRLFLSDDCFYSLAN